MFVYLIRALDGQGRVVLEKHGNCPTLSEVSKVFNFTCGQARFVGGTRLTLDVTLPPNMRAGWRK